MANTSERTKFFTESIIRRMTRISNECGAINLSQGFPDFEPPLELQEELKNVASKGPHQYAITWGAPNFLEALAKKQSRFMGIPIEAQKNIVATCGSTEAMIAALMSVVNSGDKVIVFSPFYENYGADTVLIDATAIYVPLIPPYFHFDKKALREAFEQKPKAIIICNPNNPIGKVFNKDELSYIASLAEEFDTWVITDEVYEHIVYAPNKHIYFASLPNMFERTISCGSLSKTYSITGWRLGYIIASEKVINAARKVHDFLTVGAAAPLQEAAVKALNFADSYYDELISHYTRKKKLFLKLLDEANLSYIEPQGAYYVMVDISEFNVKSDIEFCEWLACEVGVAAVPGSTFFKENIHNFIRFHFAKKDETLLEAGKRLLKLRELAYKHYV
ncbi:MAG: aminotransferase class I/II-fold pyridoxal phosphate-dependent enzyme [Campylobacteraceae bacterium]|nr:aminotransferase class I/II-fold pyridoxal phosphate-dependent enzyme [Campylobacteraceae bacterium]